MATMRIGFNIKADLAIVDIYPTDEELEDYTTAVLETACRIGAERGHAVSAIEVHAESRDVDNGPCGIHGDLARDIWQAAYDAVPTPINSVGRHRIQWLNEPKEVGAPATLHTLVLERFSVNHEWAGWDEIDSRSITLPAGDPDRAHSAWEDIETALLATHQLTHDDVDIVTA